MNYDLSELRQIADIPAKEAVAVIKELYPKFDKPMWSKVKAGTYGADLPEDAVLRHCIKSEGYGTTQEWLADKVVRYLKEGGYL